MKKVVYLTIFPNPFQFEFTNAIKYRLTDSVEFIATYEKAPPDFRKHWGKFNNGVVFNSDVSLFVNYLSESKPDIIVFTMYNSSFTKLGIRWAKKNNKQYYLGPHEILKQDGVSLIKRRLKLIKYKSVAKDAKGIITMGEQSVRLLHSALPNQRIISIPYSFDLTSLLSFDQRESPNDIVFLMSGRLYDFRNPLLGIQAFYELLSSNVSSSIKLVISGTGPLEKDCVDLIEKLKIKDYIEWYNPEFKDWYDIHNIYKKANVLLALQNYGTWGLIIQEAMAAGLGVVASNTIQAADTLIVNGYNGYVSTLNIESIVNCMQNYLDNKDLFKLHGKLNRDIVKLLDVKVAAARFIRFLKIG